jgi:hypothetical protein
MRLNAINSTRAMRPIVSSRIPKNGFLRTIRNGCFLSSIFVKPSISPRSICEKVSCSGTTSDPEKYPLPRGWLLNHLLQSRKFREKVQQSDHHILDCGIQHGRGRPTVKIKGVPFRRLFYELKIVSIFLEDLNPLRRFVTEMPITLEVRQSSRQFQQNESSVPRPPPAA